MSDVLQPRWLSNAIILLLLVTVFSFITPFLVPFAWGLWFAVLTWPLYLLLERHLQRPWLSASLMLILMLILIGLPVALLFNVSASEFHRLIRFVLTANAQGLPAPEWLAGLPLIGKEAVEWWQQSLAQPQGVAALFGSQWESISGAARAIVSVLSSWLIANLFLVLFTLIVLVCLYIHGGRIGMTLKALAPRIHPRAPEFVQAIPVAIRATAFGMGLVAVLEGVVLGVAYAVAGLPAPALLGLLTGLMALIPGGAPLSFTLASIFLYMTGHPVNALALFAWGSIELFLVDKFLRPKLIGHVIRLPFLPVFVGLVGGLQMFGLLGLVYGPAVMLLAVMLWRRAGAMAGIAPPAR